MDGGKYKVMAVLVFVVTDAMGAQRTDKGQTRLISGLVVKKCQQL